MGLLPGSVHVNKWGDKAPVSAFKKHGRRHMAAAMAYLICSRWREFGKLTLYKTQSFKGKKFFKIYINYSFSSYYKVELNLKFKILQQCKIKEALLSLGCQKNQITALENILPTKICYFFFQWI